MPEQPAPPTDVPNFAPLALSERLQEITETLAGSQTQESVLPAILQPTLSALGAIAGAVLLIDDAAQQLRLASVHGYTEGAPNLWQDGPLDAQIPAGDALLRRTPLYFEHQGALAAAYPDLEARTGATAAVASAVLPMFLDGQPLGVVVLDFREPHTFTAPEQRFLQTLAAQGAIALGRARATGLLRRQVQEQQSRADALGAFIALTEAAGASTDLERLSRRAEEVLQASIPDLVSAYYELRGERWVAQTSTQGLPAGVRHTIEAGQSVDTPAFARAVQAREPVFVDGWNAAEQRVPNTEPYRAAAFAPYFRQGRPFAMFVVGFGSADTWTAQQRKVFKAVWHSLGSALERAEQSQRQERLAALEAFVALTEAIGTETDLERLAERAANLIQSFLPGWSVGYYHLEDGRWKARVLTNIPNPELAASLRAGPPQDTPGFVAAVQAAGPIFIDGWNAQEQRLDGTESYGAAAFYPYFEHGRPSGMFAIGSQQAQAWNTEDQAVFTAVGRSLGLALDWASQAGRLQAQNTELADQTHSLDAFVNFTEAVGSETDVLVLAGQAVDLLKLNFADCTTGYYMLEDGLWKLRLYTDDLLADPDLLQVAQAGLPLDTPIFAQTRRSRAATFVDGWDPAREQVERSGSYGTAAAYPLEQGGEVQAMLVIGLKSQSHWTERERAVFRAVGRGLALALERAAQAELLQAKNAELAARTRALESFAQLTSNLSAQQDPQTLVRRAQEVALSLLAPGYALYYERDGERWRNRVQVGEVRNAELQAFIDAGPRVGQTPSVDRPWTTRQALYQDVYAQGSDTPPEMVRHVGAAASLPVLLRGEPVGVFIAVLFGQRAWTRTDQAVLDSVVRSLEIALGRAEQARQLDEERAALAAFASFTEAVGVQTDVPALSQQAVEVVGRTLGVNAAYFEREGELFCLQSWSSGCSPAFLARAKPGHTLAEPSFARAARARQVVFADDPAQAQGASAFHPFFQDGRLTGMLLMATPRAQRWSERDRAIFLAAGRGLALALERTEHARLVMGQRDILDGRTRALEAANEELEAFAYSVSHDLRTPVRHIAGFNDLLRKRLGDRSDEQVERYLTVVDQAAARMNTLLDAVLDLSRTSRAPLRLGPVDLGALVASVRSELEPDARGRPVEWQTGPLPQLTADHDILRQVLVNLLSNALKYTRSRNPAVIEVWAEERPDAWTVRVRDNGVGFDQKYQDKLFGVFQRLHRAEEFEGVGVGLANVRRAILRHGGTVFAQGELDRWAIFGFTLPKVPGQEATPPALA